MDAQLLKYVAGCFDRLGRGFDLSGAVVNWIENYYDSGTIVVADAERFETELAEFRKMVDEIKFSDIEIAQMEALTKTMRKKS